MAKQRILFISQEIYPYLPANPVSMLGKALPADTHGRLYEVRTFMPKYGSVNERRNQLHEVIRLSGMNIIIDDNDHPLILKVASLQPSRFRYISLTMTTTSRNHPRIPTLWEATALTTMNVRYFSHVALPRQ